MPEDFSFVIFAVSFEKSGMPCFRLNDGERTSSFLMKMIIVPT